MKTLRKNIAPLLFLAVTAALLFSAFSYGTHDPLGTAITQQMTAHKK